MEFLQKSVKAKLTTFILGLTLVPLVGLGAYAYLSAKKELADQARETMAAQGQLRAQQVEAYFASVRNDLLGIADSEMTRRALREFDAGFRDVPLRPEAARRVDAFVASTFGAKYRETNGAAWPGTSGFASRLEPAALALQDHFIASNPEPLGEKDALVEPPFQGRYANAHALFHPVYRGILQRQEYYDIFLVAEDGRLVYSVFKELDFATNLLTGDFRDSGIGRAFRGARALREPGAVHVEDYAVYAPSYEAPAMFLSAPALMGDGRLGVAIVQVSLERVSAIAANAAGLGAGQDLLLVGSDGGLRSDSRLSPEAHTVARSFSAAAPLRLTIDGEGTGLSVRGKPALLSVHPVTVAAGLEWRLAGAFETEEAFASFCWPCLAAPCSWWPWWSWPRSSSRVPWFGPWSMRSAPRHGSPNSTWIRPSGPAERTSSPACWRRSRRCRPS